jgi:ketosteroid isomerase-like protein
VESETAVIQAERDWNDAYLRSDFATLKAMMAGDYMDVTDDGTFDTRTTNLRSLKSGEEKFTVLSVSNVMTRIYGDVAINTGALHMELLFRGVPSGGDFLFTDIWQKRKGKWQVIASAETPTEAQQKKDEGKPKFSFAAEFKTGAEVCGRCRKAPRGIESAIMKAHHELDDGYIEQDRVKVQSILANDFTDVWDDGFTKNKQQDLDSVTDPDDRNFEFTPFGSVVRAYGGIAVFIGSLHSRGRYKGHDYEANVNELDVWHREGGGWKLVASQSVMCARQPNQRQTALSSPRSD